MKPLDIAIVGATGAVGKTMLQILEARDFPCRRVHLLASARSVGRKMNFRGASLPVQALDDFDFRAVAFGLFSAGAPVSARHASRAAQAGCVVIDNTSHFRLQADVPLVVPEVNSEALEAHHGIVANPNCSTIQMVVALKPIYDAVGIRRVNVCTYQAVSGTGRRAVQELEKQSAALLDGRDIQCQVYPQQIAFNILPHIDVFQDNGYTREEMKMVRETRKILSDELLQINPTTVRVPVFYGHSEAVHIETGEKLSAAAARELLGNAPGLRLVDAPCNEGRSYPTAARDAAGRDAVFVGRVREDISHPRGLNMWLVSDNVRKGAALNSIQIAEILLKSQL